jgi:hypothetical protein
VRLDMAGWPTPSITLFSLLPVFYMRLVELGWPYIIVNPELGKGLLGQVFVGLLPRCDIGRA